MSKKLIYDWECDKCDLCKGESRGFYYFNKDLEQSVNAVNEIANDILINTRLLPYPTDVEKKGDILLKNSSGKPVARVEVKLITTTFRKVKTILSEANLSPFEVVVIDYPKLLSYFKAQEQDGLPHFVVIKITRECREGMKVYSRLENLKKKFDKYQEKRFFDRSKGKGDDDKGITQKYHFSIDRDFICNYQEFYQDLNSLL